MQVYRKNQFKCMCLNSKDAEHQSWLAGTARRSVLSAAAVVLAVQAVPSLPSSKEKAGQAQAIDLRVFGIGNSQGRSMLSIGSVKFQQLDTREALKYFDIAYDKTPELRPYMWQRGLSLYYADRFEEGAEQFRLDTSVNPYDTEEAIWAFMCEARIKGADAAREDFVEVRKDRRAVLGLAYKCFRAGTGVEELEALSFPEAPASQRFYADLYSGLYYEAEGESDKAKEAILRALANPYGQTGDYMYSVAQVHAISRGWTAAP